MMWQEKRFQNATRESRRLLLGGLTCPTADGASRMAWLLAEAVSCLRERRSRRYSGPDSHTARSALSARRRPFTPFRVILWQERALGSRGGGVAETAKIVAISRLMSTLVNP